MAELNKKLFGSLKGKFGDAVFRQRNGKNYVAQMPESYTIPNSENFLNRTGRFRMAVKLASVVNSIPALKSIWKTKIENGITVFHKIASVNYPFVEPENLKSQALIVPDEGFGIRINSLGLEEGQLVVSINPLDPASNINVEVEKKIQLIAVVFLSSPSIEEIQKYRFIKLSSSRIDFNLTAPVSFTAALSIADNDLSALYTAKKIYATLVTYDESNVPVNFAKTFSSGI